MGKYIRRIAIQMQLLLLALALTSCGGGGGGTDPYTTINNDRLYSALKDGSAEQSFPGIASLIDTKIAFQGADMFLGQPIDSAVKALITKNVNNYLESAAPVFDGALSPLSAGVTIDTAQKKITAALTEQNGSQQTADISITWSFTGNSVERKYTKTSIAGENKGTTYSSIWSYTYSTVTGLTTATIDDTVDETKQLTSGKTQTRKAAYKGTVIYKRSSQDSTMTSLASADYSQQHTETNNDTAQTYTLNGTVKMAGTSATGGTLNIAGEYSIDLPAYKTVSGQITLTNGTYGNGYNSISNSYYNETNISNGTLTLTSQADYSGYTPATNTQALRGAWTGAFTDSCSSSGAGKLDMSITEATATWFGMSLDASRIYGSLITIDNTGLHLKNNAISWGDSSKVTATTIEGTWSSGGCGGTFSIQKQP